MPGSDIVHNGGGATEGGGVGRGRSGGRGKGGAVGGGRSGGGGVKMVLLEEGDWVKVAEDGERAGKEEIEKSLRRGF